MNAHLSLVLLYHQDSSNLVSTARVNVASHQVQSFGRRWLLLSRGCSTGHSPGSENGRINSNKILVSIPFPWINWIPDLGIRMLPEMFQFCSYIIFVAFSSSIKMWVKFIEAELCTSPDSEIELTRQQSAKFNLLNKAQGWWNNKSTPTSKVTSNACQSRSEVH